MTNNVPVIVLRDGGEVKQILALNSTNIHVVDLDCLEGKTLDKIESELRALAALKDPRYACFHGDDYDLPNFSIEFVRDQT